MSALRRLSILSLILGVGQVVFGAIVRITGSGLGCGDHWPQCHGYWFPPFTRMDLVIEVMHRYLAFTLSLTIAGLLLLAFARITDRLIPLFAIGAFMTFTLSQAGMVAHWRRELREPRGDTSRRAVRTNLLINATGALTTGAALLIIVAAKFTEGAWITIAVVPAVIVLLRSIRRYYDRLASTVRDSSPLPIRDTRPPIVLVAIDEWNQLADRSVLLAMSLSPDIFGVHLTQLEGPYTEEKQREVEEQWRTRVREPACKAGQRPPELVVLPSPYRSIHEPMLNFAHKVEEEHRDREIAVLIPELVKQHWYQRLLHANRAKRLRSQLLKHGGSRLTIINVPWYLDGNGDIPHFQDVAPKATEQRK